MKRIAIAGILATALTSPATAGPFAEIGVGVADRATCIRDYIAPGVYGCSESPLASLAVGYAWRGWSLQAEHWSSISGRDKGLNILSLKYRIEFE